MNGKRQYRIVSEAVSYIIMIFQCHVCTIVGLAPDCFLASPLLGIPDAFQGARAMQKLAFTLGVKRVERS